MKVIIENFSQINSLLNDIDLAATAAINKRRKLTVEWSDNAVTDKQLDSMHLWCRQCEKYLNSIGAYRYGDISGKKIPWKEGQFKTNVYKPFLKAWKGKASTKDQTTSEPEEIRLALSGHLAGYFDVDIVLPEWPHN